MKTAFNFCIAIVGKHCDEYMAHYVNMAWKDRMNGKLQRIYEEVDVVGFIKSARIRWLGHVYRMPHKDNIKRLIDSVPGTSRPGG